MAEAVEEATQWKARYDEVKAARDAMAVSQGDEVARLTSTLDAAQCEATAHRREAASVRQQIADLQQAAAASLDAHAAELAGVRSQHAHELSKLQERIATLQAGAASQERAFAAELAALTHTKASELELVEARVKAALKKRDDMILALRAQVEEQRARADTAHRLMVEQRRELLGQSFDAGGVAHALGDVTGRSA